jgi:hypothetical protein
LQISHLISAKNDVYVWATKKAKSEKASQDIVYVIDSRGTLLKEITDALETVKNFLALCHTQG